mmetsp:Transcript_39564/g.112981  ORF Transcript_39564/g.112981 Transcript_39564/m.112981 type:complete len:277 (-) Transcript_39564:317-1147(-)
MVRCPRALAAHGSVPGQQAPLLCRSARLRLTAHVLQWDVEVSPARRSPQQTSPQACCRLPVTSGIGHITVLLATPVVTILRDGFHVPGLGHEALHDAIGGSICMAPVGHRVKSYLLLFGCVAEAHCLVNDDGEHNAQHHRPYYSYHTAEELRTEEGIHRRPLIIADATQCGGREGCSEKCTHDPADTVHAEDVEGIIRYATLLDQGGHSIAHQARHEADDHGPRHAHKAAGGRDGAEAGNHARHRGLDGRLAPEVLDDQPDDGARASRYCRGEGGH